MRGTAGVSTTRSNWWCRPSAVVGPIVNYLEPLHAQSPEIILTVVVPEIRVPRGGTVSSAIIWASGCVGRSSTMPALRSPRCPFN
jgi:hypothetical protein